MNDTVPIALEASNANLQIQTLVPAIVGWVFIGYLWFGTDRRKFGFGETELSMLLPTSQRIYKELASPPSA
ncbi:hypothetical protein B0T13DRAFT_453402 [Neurospora crassa]|nr:hypothetical protein B0T13DRAFT_453402 [Neurospora crassa]